MVDRTADIIEIDGNAYYILDECLVVKDFDGNARTTTQSDLSTFEQIIFEALVRLSQLN